MKKVSLLILLILLFSACSTTKNPRPKPLPVKIQHKSTYHFKKKNYVTTKLFLSYEKWLGTNYCYGGVDKNGVDCSALVQSIYKEAFNIKIPRTTKAQIKIGKRVSKKDLKEGDLLFFKTSYKTLHSAIYLERGEFIHASSKHGVTLSSIHNPYWRAKYYQARRLLYEK